MEVHNSNQQHPNEVTGVKGKLANFAKSASGGISNLAGKVKEAWVLTFNPVHLEVHNGKEISIICLTPAQARTLHAQTGSQENVNSLKANDLKKILQNTLNSMDRADKGSAARVVNKAGFAEEVFKRDVISYALKDIEKKMKDINFEEPISGGGESLVKGWVEKFPEDQREKMKSQLYEKMCESNDYNVQALGQFFTMEEFGDAWIKFQPDVK